MVFNSDNVKEYTKLQLIKCLDQIQGRKGLVIDLELTSLLSIVAQFNMLKERGIDKVYTIDNKTMSGNLIFILKPTVENARLLSEIVKQNQGTIAVFFVPKRTLVCDLMLKELGIYGDIQLGEFHLDCYPYEHDLLSLNQNSFLELYLNGDISILKTLSNSIMKLQIMYGFIPTVLGVGKYAQDLFQLLEQSRLEYLSMNSLGNECEFDSMVIIDKHVDFVTMMKGQMTYEGLVDEIYGIQSCFLQFDNGANIASSSTTPKLKKILLNNSDTVYSKIRNSGFETVGQILKLIAADMKSEEDSRLTMTTSLQLKEFASKLGMIQQKRSSLETRTNINR